MKRKEDLSLINQSAELTARGHGRLQWGDGRSEVELWVGRALIYIGSSDAVIVLYKLATTHVITEYGNMQQGRTLKNSNGARPIFWSFQLRPSLGSTLMKHVKVAVENLTGG